jgi:hypothetical protein
LCERDHFVVSFLPLALLTLLRLVLVLVFAIFLLAVIRRGRLEFPFTLLLLGSLTIALLRGADFGVDRLQLLEQLSELWLERGDADTRGVGGGRGR